MEVMEEEKESDAVSVTVVKEEDKNKMARMQGSDNTSSNTNSNKNNLGNRIKTPMTLTPPPKMPEEVFNGFFLLAATIVLIITYVWSPHWNTVCNMSVMSVLTSMLYVAVRKITGRKAAPEWMRTVASRVMYAPSDSEETTSSDGKKLRKININGEKWKELWENVKKYDKTIDFTFFCVTILATVIIASVSRYWDMWQNIFICLAVLSALYLVARALTGRLRVLSVEENMEKHRAAGILACAIVLLTAGALLCFTEFGLRADDYRSINYRGVAPCAVAIGLINVGLGLVKPTRLTNFVFCAGNAVACAFGTLVAWADYGPRSIARDYHYHSLFKDDFIFMDLQTTVPLALRLLCPTVIFATTLMTAIMLIFSIISFKRKQEDKKIKKRKIAFSKLMVGIYGLLLFIVTMNKIWSISNALLMPGPMDDWSTQNTLIITTILNYHFTTLAALMAASYLGMRSSGKLEVMVLMALASTALVTDYIALTQYDPDDSLNELNNKLMGLKGCPSEYGDSYCYNIKKGDEHKEKECISASSICDGVIDIKKKVTVIESQYCDTVNDTVETYTTTPRYYYDYDENFIKIAADEVYCPFYYEPYIYSWGISALVSIVLCSFIILTAAFIPSYEGIMDKLRIKNQLSHWKTLHEEESVAGDKKDGTEA